MLLLLSDLIFSAITLNVKRKKKVELKASS